MVSADKPTIITIALAGNPNSGKTTIFNQLTGARQKVGNWGGVTVDIKEGEAECDGQPVKIVDLPGTYSLTAYSAEELTARNYIESGAADITIDIIDSSNLERNLFLAVQLMEMGRPLVFALNMSDEVDRKGVRIDLNKLYKLLDIPMQKTVGRNGDGVDKLIRLALETCEGKHMPPHAIRINYGVEIEDELARIVPSLEQGMGDGYCAPARWYAVKLLEDDPDVRQKIEQTPRGEKILRQADKSKNHLQSIFHDNPQTIIAEKRYGYIHGAIKEAVTFKPVDRQDMSQKIDMILLNRWLAFPVFGLFMWLLYQTTFRLGEVPMMWIEGFFNLLRQGVLYVLPASPIRDLFTEGMISGVGGVAVFLPNILILFFGISLLEDTGYMARAAFIMDKIMHKMGLHGKSFIPMVMGLGCNVPAIMAARTLESRKDRVLTILIAPLISCQARLPIYVLFAGALFPSMAGNIVFGMHVLSFFFAFTVGFLFRKTLFRGEEHPFVMELPPYRLPTVKSVFIHMWEKAKHYLQKMGGVVLVFSVVLWVMQSYPKNEALDKEYTPKFLALNERIQAVPSKDTALRRRLQKERETLRREKEMRFTRTTFLGVMGRGIEPLLRPAGMDWRMGVSLLTGFVAKEVVVSSMGVLYHVGQEADETSRTLRNQIRRHYTPLQGLSFMLFVLLYTPCLVAFVTLVREIRSSKWSIFSLAYQLILAWSVAFIVYRVGRMMGFA